MSSTTSHSADFLTVEEAARVLRIGRTAAYALARSWRDTGGRRGLPVVEFGRLLRVPRHALEEMAGGSITTTPAREVEHVTRAKTARVADAEPAAPPPASSTRPRHTRPTSSDQPTLPFT